VKEEKEIKDESRMKLPRGDGWLERLKEGESVNMCELIKPPFVELLSCGSKTC